MDTEEVWISLSVESVKLLTQIKTVNVLKASYCLFYNVGTYNLWKNTGITYILSVLKYRDV